MSLDPDDPAYNRHSRAEAARAKVFFQGTEITGVITADEEKRMVRRYVLDENGLIVVRNGEPITTTDFGHVRIEMPEDVDLSDDWVVDD